MAIVQNMILAWESNGKFLWRQ